MTSPKIVVRLAGGLGNQLFQLAAAVSLAQRLDLPFSNTLIDTRFLASYEAKHKYEIGFVSDLFSGVQASPQLPPMASMAARFRLAKILDKRLGSFELISSVARLNAACAIRNSASTFILDGYFQHPDILFTEEDRNRICSALFSARCFLIDQLNNGLPTIGVHIRRGDYVTSKSASKVFRNIPIGYYDIALKQLQRDQQVLVFSDDRELSASYATKVGGIDVRKLKLSLQDEFCLLMACDDHIIANSTFSWWAAYLGHKPGGRVIAPQNWYHDKSRSQSNPLLLPHFELIDA
ncbi:alpha-1,2-fucosyltransferase [Shewanella sp.]|uniref:alpha-1,2-fucosyltransferase n=1 Tax=Shewanella sp. TaxID=50422 RepID=UPI0040489AE5